MCCKLKVINASHILVTLFLPVPVSSPSITISNVDTVYAGTTLSLTCYYTLSSSVDTTPQIVVTWAVDGVAVDTSPGRISSDGATLSFSPLATSDTGSYTCTLTVTTSQTHVTVQGPEQSEEEGIIVEGNYTEYNTIPAIYVATSMGTPSSSTRPRSDDLSRRLYSDCWRHTHTAVYSD